MHIKNFEWSTGSGTPHAVCYVYYLGGASEELHGAQSSIRRYLKQSKVPYLAHLTRKVRPFDDERCNWSMGGVEDLVFDVSRLHNPYWMKAWSRIKHEVGILRQYRLERATREKLASDIAGLAASMVRMIPVEGNKPTGKRFMVRVLTKGGEEIARRYFRRLPQAFPESVKEVIQDACAEIGAEI